jgi:hypothetical protein
MIQADRVLDDEDLIAPFFEALAMRHPKSRSRGPFDPGPFATSLRTSPETPDVAEYRIKLNRPKQ